MIEAKQPPSPTSLATCDQAEPSSTGGYAVGLAVERMTDFCRFASSPISTDVRNHLSRH